MAEIRLPLNPSNSSHQEKKKSSGLNKTNDFFSSWASWAGQESFHCLLAQHRRKCGWNRRNKSLQQKAVEPISHPPKSLSAFMPSARVADKGLHMAREGTDVQESPSWMLGGRVSIKCNERTTFLFFTVRTHPSPRTQPCSQISCQVAHWLTQKTMGQEVPHLPLAQQNLNSGLLNKKKKKKEMRILSSAPLSNTIPWSWRLRQTTWSACRNNKHTFTTCLRPNGLSWKFHSDAKF